MLEICEYSNMRNLKILKYVIPEHTKMQKILVQRFQVQFVCNVLCLP
jgi:hypothetical protein